MSQQEEAQDKAVTDEKKLGMVVITLPNSHGIGVPNKLSNAIRLL